MHIHGLSDTYKFKAYHDSPITGKRVNDIVGYYCMNCGSISKFEYDRRYGKKTARCNNCSAFLTLENNKYTCSVVNVSDIVKDYLDSASKSIEFITEYGGTKEFTVYDNSLLPNPFVDMDVQIPEDIHGKFHTGTKCKWTTSMYEEYFKYTDYEISRLFKSSHLKCPNYKCDNILPGLCHRESTRCTCGLELSVAGTTLIARMIFEDMLLK